MTTLRVERDPAFWAGVAADRGVAVGRMGLTAAEVGALAVGAGVLPLASQNGGYLFARLDAMGAGFELHALYAEAGWGREAHAAGRLALRELFAGGALFEGGALMITAFEMPAIARSRPPRSFGFRHLGPAHGALGPADLWMLSRAAWMASPAFRRMETEQCQQP